MPAVEELKQSSETDNIRASLDVTAYSYPQQNMSAVQSLDSWHVSPNLLLEYMAMLRLRKQGSDLQQKITTMEHLRPNWDTYGAEPPSTEAMNRAREVLVVMEYGKFIPADAVASAEGGVALSFVAEGRYADIEFLNSGDILAVTVTGQEEPYVWEVEPNSGAVAKAIERIRTYICA